MNLKKVKYTQKKLNLLASIVKLCVLQLVEVNTQPRIKLSEDVEKVTMPGKKDVYRLYGHDGTCHSLPTPLKYKPGLFVRWLQNL